MAEHVSQRRPADRTKFEFRYLREFVAAADALKLSDRTEVFCHVSRWSGAVISLRTLTTKEETADDEPAVTPTPSSAAPPSAMRTIVVQDATGPEMVGRHWGRRYSARVLTLGDVRALIARVDEIGMRTDSYTADGYLHGVGIHGRRAAGSGGLYVRSISAVPFP